MEEHSQTHERLPVKWLRILFYAHIATTFKTCVSYLPIDDTWTVWLGWAICALCIACLFRLSPAGTGYRKAAILKAAQLVCMLVGHFLVPTLTYAASTLSIISCYFELHSHAQLAQELNPKLSKAFHRIFAWYLLLYALSLFSSAIVTVLRFVNIDVIFVTKVISYILIAGGLVFKILYPVYLYRLLRQIDN